MTPEERAGQVEIQLDYDGTIHAEATSDRIAAAIREAVAEEREWCKGQLALMEAELFPLAAVADLNPHAAPDTKEITLTLDRCRRAKRVLAKVDAAIRARGLTPPAPGG